MVCASCLRQLAGPARPARRRWRRLVSLTQGLLALFLLWLCFYGVGRALIAIPTSFHEGTLWRHVAGADP